MERKTIKTILRIFFAVVSFCLLIYIGFFGLLIAGFSTSRNFYVPFVLVFVLLLASIIIVWATNKLKGKILLISLGIIMGLSIVSISIYEIYRYTIDIIPVLNENERNLELYLPFIENTKAVSLDEPSTLQFTDSLPSMDGATALYPLYAAFVKATYPTPEEMEFPIYDDESDTVNDKENIKYLSEYSFYHIYNGHIRGGTTPDAYNSLVEGVSDVIFCAQPSREQLEEIQKTGKELHMTPIGREAFVFFVNAKNPVNNLTPQQIREIYSGEITNWKQLGGKDKKIRAFQRPKGSGSQTMLLHIMEESPLMDAPEDDRVISMGEIIDYTANYRNHNNAIGYSFLFFTTEMVSNNEIKLLSINGIKPEIATIQNNTYPFTGAFYAITLGEPKPNVKKLIDWILSEQGQKLVEMTGYVPINMNYKTGNDKE